jgi:hypothetical protein
MSKTVYTGFIGYVIKNLLPLVTRTEWREYLQTQLGSSPSEDKLKKVALILYYSHYAALVSCVSQWELIHKLGSPTKLRSFIKDNEGTRASYKLSKLPVVFYNTDAKAINHMKTFSAEQQAFKDTLRVPVSKPSTKRAPAKRSSSSKLSSSKICKDYKVTELRAEAAKRKISGRSKMNKEQLCKELGIKSTRRTTTTRKAPVSRRAPAKRKTVATRNASLSDSCKKYTITQLRKEAAAKKIPGRSKMNKAQLCKALKK